MQSIDYVCSDCNEKFETASLLLQHFALHVSLTETTRDLEKSNLKIKKCPIPDLYPIKSKRFVRSETSSIRNKNENEDNVDSGFEDVNPITYCQVTMADKKNETNQLSYENDGKAKGSYKSKRFICVYCTKSFGWSTDLKRHVLIHTGERPFKCDYCKLSFTRNFLLHKHKLKYHGNSERNFNISKTRIPSLNPLDISGKHKPRKQEKCNIKRKMCSTKAMYQSKVYRYNQSTL